MPFKNTIINKSTSVTQNLTKTSQFYKGFSTVGSDKENSTLYDFALVKQDIINHFNTKKGERLMNPEFGSSIWDLIMEPITDTTRRELTADIETICNYDPRVVPTQLDITEYDNGYLLEITLTLKETNQSESIKLAFDQKLGLVVQQ